MLQTLSLTLERIAEITGGTVTGPAAGTPSGYSIDTRTLRPGDLFFAIVGPNQDGHRFAAEAMAKGASGLVIADAGAIPASPGGKTATTPVVVVADTLRALQDLAAHVRRAHPVKVVGITGSSGKTTTKEMTRQALESAFKVHASRGNLNNLFGCPLSLLELRAEHQVSVLEMGMSYHGELTRLAEIADPDIGILTNVSGVHLAHFLDVDDVAAAKAELFAGMRDNTIGIFNIDDDRCRRIKESFKGYAFTFGIERSADLTAMDYRMEGLSGGSFNVEHAHDGGIRRVQVRTRFPGVHHVYNALAAMSAGYMLGIDLEAMAARLATLEPLGMRGRVVRLRDMVRILDESYNSNPAAMRSALQVLVDAQPLVPDGRRIVVFGDMLELGEGETEAHRELGRTIVAAGPALAIGVGPLARIAVESIEEARGAAAIQTRWFPTSVEAAADVAAAARPGDIVLVKGSRGIALERIVNAVKERFGEE